MEEAAARVEDDVAFTISLETSLRGRKGKKKHENNTRNLEKAIKKNVNALIDERRRSEKPKTVPSDSELSQYCRFTDSMAIEKYSQFLRFVPRLVNVVTARHLPTLLATTPFLPLTAVRLSVHSSRRRSLSSAAMPGCHWT